MLELVKKQELVCFIQKYCDSEDFFYAYLNEDKKTFWEKFNNNMEFTSKQMQKMIILFHIENPFSFFYN